MLNEIDLSRVDLNLLTLFDIIMRERSVARAADRLNLSASAVSHGLGRLRRLLGDPLFLRTPRGVAPTERALTLAEPVAELLSRARRIVATAEPFDPARSTRRFLIGAPDAVAAVTVDAIRGLLAREGPQIDLGVRQLIPHFMPGAGPRGWEQTLADLDARRFDVAMIPLEAAPARFHAVPLYAEDFVAAARASHPFLAAPGLDAFCAASHLLVSVAGDATGFVDDVLAALGRSRRIALTAPNFMLGLALLARGDLVAALPRRLAAVHGPTFGVAMAELPVTSVRTPIQALVPKVALMDAGVDWFLDLVTRAGNGPPPLERG